MNIGRDDDLYIESFYEEIKEETKLLENESFDDEIIDDDNYAMDCIERARDMQIVLRRDY